MRRIILIYGTLAGVIIITTNTLNLELGQGQVWLGFLVMFIAFSSIFVAVRQHRDQHLGGVITFSKALQVGLGISVTAGFVYVALWELYLALTDYQFIDLYVESAVEAMRLNAAGESDLVAATAEGERLRTQYTNPLIRLPMTFVEVFPIGLVVSLACAGTLRNHVNRSQD